MNLATIVDIIFSLCLFINAVLFIPQIIKLYQTKNSEGFSAITFAGFNVITTIYFTSWVYT